MTSGAIPSCELTTSWAARAGLPVAGSGTVIVIPIWIVCSTVVPVGALRRRSVRVIRMAWSLIDVKPSYASPPRSEFSLAVL